MPTGLLALAALGALYVLTQQKKGGGEPGATGILSAAAGIPDDVRADVLKLQKADPQTFAMLNAFFTIPPPPVILPAAMAEMAGKLFGSYGALGNFLNQRAVDISTQVTGKSTTQWMTWSPGTSSDGTTMVSVMWPVGMVPVLTYRQKGSDQSTRVLVTQDTRFPADVISKARADFSV